MMRRTALLSVVPPLLLILFSMMLSLASGCKLADPPRLATATAQSGATPTATLEPLRLSAPVTPANSTDESFAPEDSGGVNPVLTIWVNETSAAHTAILQEMKTEFTSQTAIDLEVIQVAPMLLPDLVNTAVLSDTLPDLILYPIAYAAGWGERGVFNNDAHAASLENLAEETFNPTALDLLTVGETLYGLPSDGFHQLLLYRTDLFASASLAVPDNYEAILAAAASTTDRENARSGWVIPTESNLVTTHQAFEQLALANGCELIDEKGEVLLLEPQCRETITFYFNIVHEFSPLGVQTDTSARNAYLAGRTGMIIAPPSVLPLIAGLDETALPSCPACLTDPDYLLQNTGILTAINGTQPSATPATFSDIRVLSITRDAPFESAQKFAEYWFDAGYLKWLSVDPDLKVPLRWGVAAEPRLYIDSWGDQPLTPNDPSLKEIFGAETVAQLRDNIASAPRWGIPQGHGTLVTLLIEDLLFSVILQEMLSGYFGPDRTIVELYLRVTGMIPNYAYPVDPETLEVD